MFKLHAAQRLLSTSVVEADIDEHQEEDEEATKDFLETNPQTAADTLSSRDERDTSSGMSASADSTEGYSTQNKTSTRDPGTAFPMATLLAAKLKASREHTGAMGDNSVSTDPLLQGVEDSNPREIEADSTTDNPFDMFESSIPSIDINLEDQPDVVRGAKRKPKHPKKKPAAKRKSKPKAMLDRLLDEQSIMYQNEASAVRSKASVVEADSTVDVDSPPGSTYVKFPVSRDEDENYMAATFDTGCESHEMLGEESEEGEVQILSDAEEESDEGEEVLGDADALHLWNVANQPLS
jgi:hypothetical protein